MSEQDKINKILNKYDSKTSILKINSLDIEGELNL